MITALLLFSAAATAPAPRSFDAAVAQKADLAWFDYYVLAGTLLKQGAREDAGVAFYVGQIRGRAHVRCDGGDPSGAPALLGALNDAVGTAVNGDLGASPRRWISSIERALAWDEAHPEAVLASTKCRADLDFARDDKRKMLAYIRDHKDEIRSSRSENGLPNEPE